MTILFAVHVGNVTITPPYSPAFLQSIGAAFIIFSGLCVAGVFASLARGNVR